MSRLIIKSCQPDSYKNQEMDHHLVLLNRGNAAAPTIIGNIYTCYILLYSAEQQGKVINIYEDCCSSNSTSLRSFFNCWLS